MGKQAYHVDGLTDYVTVKQEVTYSVPKKEYESGNYVKPRLIGEEIIYPVYKPVVYEVPEYVSKTYEIPVLEEKTYEKPVIIEKELEYTIPRITYTEEVNVIEVPYKVKVPEVVKHDIHVKNAVVEDVRVLNAIIEDVHIDAIHPHYVCGNCKKEIKP